MARPTRTHISDLRGAAKLAVDASSGITDIVEKMHRTIQMLPGPLGRISPDATRGITGLVYRSVRGGMQLAGKGIDAGLAPLLGLLPDDGQSSPTRDAVLAALNGAYGDHLARTHNPLAIEMAFRCEGRLLDIDRPSAADCCEPTPASGRKLLVLIHGLCLNDQQWLREGHDHGAALAQEFGFAPLYLRYNSGLRIGANGRGLADSLESLLARWPQPVDEVVLIGHSMGGLVARSAVHHSSMAGHRWTSQLSKMICLGTPHHGAPLERGGHGLDFLLEISPYSAPFTRIGKSRSAGITDLRHGSITEADSYEFVPLPAGVKCYAAAATLGTKRSLLSERLVGDGLVPLDSALGQHTDPARTLGFPKARQWIGYGIGHLQLLSDSEVHAQLRKWLAQPR
jgi:pimeloyl-ACP methyl ester carboxylesterase